MTKRFDVEFFNTLKSVKLSEKEWRKLTVQMAESINKLAKKIEENNLLDYPKIKPETYSTIKEAFSQYTKTNTHESQEIKILKAQRDIDNIMGLVVKNNAEWQDFDGLRS